MNLYLIAGFAFLVAGCLGTVQLIKTYLHAHRSNSWPETPGVVLSNSIKDDETYVVELTYRYVADGKEYVRSTINFDFLIGYLSTKKADSISKNYPIGSPVMVRYNPADPGIAVLEAGLSARSLFRCALAILMLIFFVYQGSSILAREVLK